jgi:predicted phosphodiesterase
VRLDDARQLFSNPKLLDSLEGEVTRGVKHGLLHLLLKAVLVALAGTFLLTALVYRRIRDIVIAMITTSVALAATAGYARLTWHANALKTPTYTGLLTMAPAAIGNVEDLQTNFTRYGEELAKIVTNVSKLYDVTSALPQGPSDLTIRVLFVSDIHDNPSAFDVIKSVVAQFGVAAVVDTGDLSDHGYDFENKLYSPISQLPVPYVFVRGNHDSASTEAAIRAMPNAVVLDDTVQTVAGLRIAGSGDPNFTPDQSNTVSADDQAALLQQQGERLAADFGATADRPAGADIVLVHEPPAAAPLFGRVPLVLSGHTHVRSAESHDGTQLLVQGSTGGAGLRGLEHTTPTPLDLSVLYFDPTTKKLVAYDDLQLGGLGQTSVEIQRHAVPTQQLHIPGTPLPTPAPAPPASPAPTPTPTPTASIPGSPAVRAAVPRVSGRVAAAP